MHKKELLRIVLLSLCLLHMASTAFSQRISLKTNALEWLTLTPNIGAEFTFSNLISVELDAAYSPFNFQKFSTEHFTFTPEIKFWPGMPSIAHAIGVAATVSSGHLSYNGKHLDGIVAGFGPTYTYAWIISEHWNIEVTCGVGCYYYRGFKYDSSTEKPPEPNFQGWMAGPLKLGATFVYLMR